MLNRYDALADGQLVVHVTVNCIKKGLNNTVLFFGAVKGENVLFRSDYYFRPAVYEGELVVGERGLTTKLWLGDIVHAICERTENGLRAKRWCLASDIRSAREEIRTRAAQSQVASEVQSQYDQLETEEERRRIEDPADIVEALENGWKIVRSRGCQRVLERQFPGEAKPRRITRHNASVETSPTLKIASA